MGGLGLMGRLCGWDRADGGVVAGTSGPRALLLAPWSWRGFGLHHTQMCNSALPVLPLGPCSHSMVHPVPWLWYNQGVVLSSVCALIPPASEQAKVGALVHLALAFGLHPTIANGVPGAVSWHLFPTTSPQKQFT